MVENVNVFCFVVMNWILDECNACLIVNAVIIVISCGNSNSSRSLLNQTPLRVILDAIIYSALVVESAIICCFLFDQLVLPLAVETCDDCSVTSSHVLKEMIFCSLQILQDTFHYSPMLHNPRSYMN